MNTIKKDLQQKSITLSHINLYMKKVHKAENEVVKERLTFKVIGILSLAKMLDIISPEEYEHFYNELYN